MLHKYEREMITNKLLTQLLALTSYNNLKIRK